MKPSSSSLSPRGLVILVAVTLVVVSLVVSGVAQWHRGTEDMSSRMIRMLLTILLAGALARGWRAARVITVILTFMGGITALAAGLSFMRHPAQAFAPLALGLIYLACAGALVSPRAGRYFRGDRSPS